MRKLARLGRGICVFLLVGALLPVIFSATTPSASANPGWWDAEWTERDNITIYGYQPENYQLKVMLPFFDNSIRFLENEDAGVLPYWVENWTESSMTVWVRRLENSDNKIYVYYGNAGAGSAENAENTFIFFDDFSGSSLNTDKWTVLVGTPTIDNSLFLDDGERIETNTWTGNTIRVKFKLISPNEYGITNYQISGLFDFAANKGGGSTNTYYNWDFYTNSTAAKRTTISSYAGTHVFEVLKNAGTSSTIYVDNELAATHTTQVPNVAVPLHFEKEGSNDLEVDWVFAAQYVFPEPTTYPHDAPPTIVSVTSSQALVDRKQDVSGSEAVLTTTITVRIQDNNGKDNMTGARIAVRDATTSTVRENVDVWASRVVVDEYTWDVSYTYNPADDLPNGALGNFDVWAYVTDDNQSAADWYTSKFVVNDGTTTINFNPSSPYSGWLENIYGTISRVGGGSASATNVVLADNRHGTFDLGSGNSWSKTYTVTASPNENVGVVLKWIDGVLDGTMASSYVVATGMKYRFIYLYWEENNTLAVENATLTAYMPSYGTQDNAIVNGVLENVVYPEQPYLLRLAYGEYYRSLIPTTGNDTITFWITDSDDLNSYTFNLVDMTGLYGPPSGILKISKMYGTMMMKIHEAYWQADLNVSAYLITNHMYQLTVKSDFGGTRMAGDYTMGLVSPITVQISSFDIPDLSMIFTNIYWTAYRLDNTSIRTILQDNTGKTTSATLSIYDASDTWKWSTIIDNGDFTATWLFALNGMTYTVVLDVTRDDENLAFFTVSMPVGLMGGEYVLPPPEGDGISEQLGLPVSIAAIISLFVTLGIGAAFDARTAVLAGIGMALSATFFWAIGWLPTTFYTPMLVLFLAMMYALSRRRMR